MVFWVFGYGSLVWNPSFEFNEKVIGFIKDYNLALIIWARPSILRELCIWSTLKELLLGSCLLFAWRAGEGKGDNAECEYDHKTLVDLFKEGESEQPLVTGVIVFISTPDKISNKYYLGPAPLEHMARQIATAHGPRAKNKNYLFLLEKAMFDIGHEDDYVIELANEVRKVLEIIDDIPNEKVSVSPSDVNL